MSSATHYNRTRSTENPQPTFLSAIAQEMANLHGGTAQQHADGARQVLEAAFRNMERKKRVVTPSRAVHAA